MMIRLGVCALALACALTVLALVANSSEGLEGILYEDLTCEELAFSYSFNREVLEDMLVYHDGCLEFIDPELSGHDHGALGCSFIREHGLFVQGIVNDIAAVHNIKCADE
ncbi:hypothetical protein LCGC14_2944360 [marine sediment metagenome]|uniref:Uncharacterized protein n=1 Tax=marine sediment metagenome TaxID=412755 RepID=A0A0F9A856_9ZZZZ